MYYNYFELYEPVISILCPELGDNHKLYKITIASEPEEYDIGLIQQSQSFCEMLKDAFEDNDSGEIIYNNNPEFFPHDGDIKEKQDSSSKLIGDTLYMIEEQEDFDIDDFIVCDFSFSLNDDLIALCSTIALDNPTERPSIIKAH